jgi:hypothetical protein
MQYRIMQPKGVTRSQRYNINQWSDYDFGKRNTGSGYNVNAHVQFKNFWYIGGGITASMENVSNADLRGGPSIRYPGGMYYWNYINSDHRKKLSGELSTEIFRGSNNYSANESYNLDLSYRPVNALNVTVSSSLLRNRNHMQWVSSSDETGKTEYIVGEIDQTVARVSLRVTYMITPNLSLQYWGQPFGTIGKYKNFKTITDARAKEYANRYLGIPVANLQMTDNIYDVDLDGNGMRDLSFDNPDFNFGQFRSNMVIRWEYIPGSTVFLVWTRERNGSFYENSEGQRYSPVLYPFQFDERAHDIFLLKFTYRFVL